MKAQLHLDKRLAALAERVAKRLAMSDFETCPRMSVLLPLSLNSKNKMKLVTLIAILALSLNGAFSLRGDSDENDMIMATIFRPNEISARWVRQLGATDPAQADQAVIKLMMLGPIAIDELMRSCDSQQPFHGLCMYREIDNFYRGPSTVGYVVMYLIPLAILDQHPRGRRFLRPEHVTTEQAAKIYKEWYREVLNHREKPQDIDKYLKLHGLTW